VTLSFQVRRNHESETLMSKMTELDDAELSTVAGGLPGWSNLDCVSRGAIVGTVASKVAVAGAMGVGWLVGRGSGATVGLGIASVADDFINTGANVAYRKLNGCTDSVSAPSK
jgi:hypothetical protein